MDNYNYGDDNDDGHEADDVYDGDDDDGNVSIQNWTIPSL